MIIGIEGTIVVTPETAVMEAETIVIVVETKIDLTAELVLQHSVAKDPEVLGGQGHVQGPEVLHGEEFELLPGTMCPYRKCRSTSLIGNSQLKKF